MTTMYLKWVWELTPQQVFQKNRFVRTAGTGKLPQERRGFSTPKLPLTGTEFVYQLALTSKGRNEESKQLRDRHKDLPDSGDYRSGVLIFSGDVIIASLILSGLDENAPFKMAVNPEHRGEKLGERLLVEWWSQVCHTFRESGKQPMNVASVKVLLNAYRTVVSNAGNNGRPVPSLTVINAQADQVLKAASQVEGVKRS